MRAAKDGVIIAERLSGRSTAAIRIRSQAPRPEPIYEFMKYEK